MRIPVNFCVKIKRYFLSFRACFDRFQHVIHVVDISRSSKITFGVAVKVYGDARNNVSNINAERNVYTAVNKSSLNTNCTGGLTFFLAVSSERFYGDLTQNVQVYQKLIHNKRELRGFIKVHIRIRFLVNVLEDLLFGWIIDKI